MSKKFLFVFFLITIIWGLASCKSQKKEKNDISLTTSTHDSTTNPRTSHSTTKTCTSHSTTKTCISHLTTKTYTSQTTTKLCASHSFGEWQILENPSCCEEGLKRRQCSICSYIENENIPVLDHSYSNDYIIDIEPTCLTAGSKSRHCTGDNCQAKTDVQLIPIKEHLYENNICVLCNEEKYTEGLLFSPVYQEGSNIIKSYTVTGIGTATDSKIVIPKIYLGAPVTTIASNAFLNCTNITSIKALNNIEKIEEGAFSGCSALQEITLPFVGDKSRPSDDSTLFSFGYIFGKTNYEGGISVTQSYLLNSTTTSANYILPSTLTSVIINGGFIKNFSFTKCSMLKTLELGEGVTTIGNSILGVGSGIENVYITENIKDITITSLAPLASSKLKFNSFNGIDYLGSKTNPYIIALRANATITSATLHESCINVSTKCFSSCSELTSIFISNSVANFGNSLFNCNKLTDITIAPNNNSFSFNNGCLVNTTNKKLIYMLQNNSIPDDGSVEIIGKSAFANKLLTSITIPNGITEIEDSAFLNCTNLASVNLPDSLEKIGNNVFSGCSNLQQLEFPNNITEIGDKTFYNCLSLNEVVLPSNLLNIGESCFYNCTSLATIDLPDSLETIELWALRGCTSLETIVFPNEILIIDDALCYGCTNLKYVTLPNKLVEIGSASFAECTSLQNITFPNTLKKIGESGFRLCESLTRIVLPEGFEEIESVAFSNCYEITYISLPSTIKYIDGIGNSASLERKLKPIDLHVAKSINEWFKMDIKFPPLNHCGKLYLNNSLVTSVTIPSDITIIPEYLFCGVTSLTNVTFHSNVKEISRSAFANTSLTNVTLPNGLEIIEDDAFARTLISKIIIPKSVIDLAVAFHNCNNLTTIHCRISSIPERWQTLFHEKKWANPSIFYKVVWGYTGN